MRFMLLSPGDPVCLVNADRRVDHRPRALRRLATATTDTAANVGDTDADTDTDSDTDTDTDTDSDTDTIHAGGFAVLGGLRAPTETTSILPLGAGFLQFTVAEPGAPPRASDRDRRRRAPRALRTRME
jgi:hypothetical protein